jgi:hypothetical protein
LNPKRSKRAEDQWKKIPRPKKGKARPKNKAEAPVTKPTQVD